MSSAISQKQLLRQLQKLSPQQIQMIKLLELPALQLEERIKQEVEENPVLDDIIDSEHVDGENSEVDSDEDSAMWSGKDDIPYYKSHVNNYSNEGNKQPRNVNIYEGESLGEHLENQLSYSLLPEDQIAIAKYLVGCIDDDGYLRRDLQSISDDIAFSYGKEIEVEVLEKALMAIQQLEPAGVGARDLRECLLLQLKRSQEPSKAKKTAIRILENYFTDFTKKHYEKLMARIGVSEDDFRDAIEEIKHLSPKPGGSYNSGGNIDTNAYITPDFILRYDNGQFELSLNSYNIPELKISKHYSEMVEKMSQSSPETHSEEDKEALQYVKNKINSAVWFIKAIKQRHDTLMRTMKAILEYQHKYFEDGNERNLRPMILKDVADLTGLDVSTISRVVNSKYVQTHFGIIPLKHLFSESMIKDGGEEVSSHEIKNIIQDCVNAEDKRKPRTDEALMDILNEKGYKIARRTVAKYREMMDIPVARLRKEI